MSKAPLESRAAYAVRQERDGPQDILSVGQQCTAPSCGIVDFLPTKCAHCSQPFCQDHYRPESHECSKWNPSEADRRALECPLCFTPIAIPPGEDPNIRLGQHVDDECTVMTGKAAKKSSTPICARPRCDKRLWQPIECEKCHQQFCATHRHPTSHTCSTATSPSPSASAPSAISNSLNIASSQMSAKSSAALAAFKRSVASNMSTRSSSSKPAPAPRAVPVVASASTSSAASKISSSSSGLKLKANSNPFSSKDRRATAERKSQLHAMQERQKKGLLNPAEEEKLKALEASVKAGKDDCVVM